MEAEGVELALHGGDRRFERGVLAGDEAFCLLGIVRPGAANGRAKYGEQPAACPSLIAQSRPLRRRLAGLRQLGEIVDQVIQLLPGVGALDRRGQGEDGDG